MKFAVLFSILIFSSYSFCQVALNTDQREQMSVYEEHCFYIKLNSGHSLGSSIIAEGSNAMLTSYPELKYLFENGVVLSIDREFKVVGRDNPEIGNIYRVRVQVGQGLNQLIAELSACSYIDFSEKIPLYFHALTPNDADYSDLSKRWHLDQIDAEMGWNVSTGCVGVKVAIVDDAVLTTHEDLIQNMYTNSGEIAGNGVDDDGNGYVDDMNGYDVADNDGNPNPPSSATNSFFTHGTHVAGIACGSSNNSIGTASIGFNTMFIPIKSKSDGNMIPGALNNPMAGVEYAIAIEANVINMSWGSYGYSAAHQMIIDQAYSDGITCIAAAGNDGYNFLPFPAQYSNVIAVGATDQTDELASFSNRNTDITVFAPGVNIWSTLAGTTNSYGFLSGTSMSAPIISGLAALMICHDASFGPDEIKSCLRSGADIVPSTVEPAFNIHRANAYQTLSCSAPVEHDCSPSICELIENGGFETTANSNIVNYPFPGAVLADQVCGWKSFRGNTDVYPLNTPGVENYGHIFMTSGVNGWPNGQYWEGMVSNLLDLIPGEEYILEFDYAVAAIDTANPSIPLDSIVISFIENNFLWVDTLSSIQNIGAIHSPAVDFTISSASPSPWEVLMDGIIDPQPYYHHFSMIFQASSDFGHRRLMIYPQLSSFLARDVCIDNVSVRPYVEVDASASDISIDLGNCTDLSATGNGDLYVWEPASQFANPQGANQTACPDSTMTFTVSAYDNVTGCTTSDTITIFVDPSVSLNEVNTLEGLDIYPNPTFDYVLIDATEQLENLPIMITTIDGKIMYNGVITSQQINKIDVRSWSTGAYICRMGTFQSTFIKR